MLNNFDDVNNVDLTKTRKAIKTAQKIKQDKIEKQSQNEIVQDTSNVINNMNVTEFFKINIYITKRNSRKHITTIENIPPNKFNDREKVDRFMSKFKTIIASRATLKNKDDNPIIEFSGDCVERIIPLLCEFTSCDKSDIVIHGTS